MTVLTFLTRVVFGHGLRSELPAEMARAGIRRPLFVTDRGVVAAGVFAVATEAVTGTFGGAAGLPRFDEAPPNPTEGSSRAGADLFRKEGCDGVIGIGGGAALDLAKAIAILATDDAPLWAFCNRHASPRPIVNPAPLLLMPTTSGSGSEVGRSAVIVFDNGVKAGVGCPTVVKAAICDPELTLGLPPRVTAATGMDALAHCIETYCSSTVNPPADAVVLDGMGRIAEHLERAVNDGADRDARWNMMMGALEGAIGFQKGMGAVHALSHPLGAFGHHHGTLNAILLPPVLAHNRDWLGDKPTVMKRIMGLDPVADLGAAIAGLNRRIGLPARLSELGVTEDQLPGIAEAALSDNAHKTNPRPLAQSDYETILRAVF